MKTILTEVTLFVLQIRREGDEYEVKVFTTHKEAERAVYDFFIEELSEYTILLNETEDHLFLDDFEDYLHVSNIGFFKIEKQEVYLPYKLDINIQYIPEGFSKR